MLAALARFVDHASVLLERSHGNMFCDRLRRTPQLLVHQGQLGVRVDVLGLQADYPRPVVDRLLCIAQAQIQLCGVHRVLNSFIDLAGLLIN